MLMERNGIFGISNGITTNAPPYYRKCSICQQVESTGVVISLYYTDAGLVECCSLCSHTLEGKL